jgi:hypothetical protein
MVKSGKYEVKQPNIFGRIGSGIGKGLAEQLPKEMDRGRLSAGLQQFEKNAENLSPFQQYTQLIPLLSGTPNGAQALQALPEVLRQQNQSKALIEQSNAANQPQPFPVQNQGSENQPSAGLTTRPGLEATRKGYIPPSYQQTLARAGELYKNNPQLYSNDPQKAITAAQQEASQNQAINQAYQQQRQGEQNIQNAVQSNLQTQASLLNAKVPGNVYSDIEQRATRSVLPKEEGGEGLTDQEAKIKYGNELDEVSRQYQAIKTLASPSQALKPPSEVRRGIESLRKDFKKRKDLRNFADSLITENKLSPSIAYNVAYPTTEIPELSKTLSKIPDVNPKTSFKKGFPETKNTDYNPDAILKHITPKLAENMGKEGSPLSISQELYSKGYDPAYFMDYIKDNREKLELTSRQADEITKSRNFLPTLDDLWLFKLSGQDKLVD